MTTYSLTHARHDPAHCLAPLLFRSLQKGERGTSKLHVVYEFGSDRIEFKGPEPLGADDLRVLQGLVALAGPSTLLLNQAPKQDDGVKIREKLHLSGDAESDEAILIKSSYRLLAHEIGYAADSGKTRQAIRSSIERLWQVSIIVQSGKTRKGFRMLSEYRSDDGIGANDGRLYVALNPRITEAVLSERPFARIDMEEVRKLKTDPARLLHQRLCGVIDPAKTRKITLDKLCSYVWSESKVSTTIRQRKFKVRSALKELGRAGWTIDEYEAAKFSIKRP